MVLMYLAGLHVAVEPAVDGLEGDAEFLGQLWLAKPVFEAVGIELINEVLGHSRYGYDITSYNACQANPHGELSSLGIPVTSTHFEFGSRT